MSNIMDRSVGSDDGKIVLDGAFVRAQVREAIKTFFTPLVGVYAAAMGKRVTFLRRERGVKRAA